MEENILRIDLSKQKNNFSELDNLQDFTEIKFHNYTEKIAISLVLNDFPNITRLSFSGNANEDVFEIPDNVEKLIYIKHVTLWRNCDFTKGKPMPNLEELHTIVQNTEEDFRNIITLFPNLKHIDIWGNHTKDQKLPDEIGNLSQLESLSLISCGVDDLPDSIVNLKKLTELNLIGLSMNRFPEVITELENLESLTIMQSIKKIPDSFLNLKKLRKLNLNSALNDGNMEVADIIKEEKLYLRPIPAVIGKLENLEDLDLGICGVYDLTPVFLLHKLKKLNLKYSALKNCDGFSNFPLLEELMIDTSYDLNDLNGLKGLPLKKLNISSNYFKSIEVISSLTLLETLDISGCSYIKDYSPLYNHPTIKELEADNEIEKKWKHREKYNKLVKIDLIISQLETDDLIEFEQAILNLSKHVDANFNDENNPLAGYFDIEVNEEEITPIEVLDSGIQKHLKNLSEKTLITIFGMTFKSVGSDNFTATLIVLQEIILRKNASTQEKIIKKFNKVCKFYDAGHRYWGYTVHDQLIDVIFGQFTSEALYKLLKKASTDMLNSEGGDAMDELFVPAFQNTEDEKLQENILNVFFKYKEKAITYYGNDYFDALLQQIKSVISPNLQQLISVKKQENKEETELIRLLRESKEENLPMIIDMLGNEISEELLNNYLYKITDACKKVNLPETSVTKLLDFLIDGDKVGYLPGILTSQYHKNDPDKIFVFLKKHIDKKRFSSTLLVYLIKTIFENLTDVNIPLKDLKKYEDFAVNNCDFSYDQVYSMQTENLLNQFFKHDSYRSSKDISWILENVKTILEKVSDEIEFKDLKYSTYLLLESEQYEKAKEVFDVLYPKIKNTKEEGVLFLNVIASVKLNDKSYFDILYKEVQQEVKEVLLAYNLACAFAHFEKKEEMIFYIREALRLGKLKQQFLDDSDFEKYWKDEDFLAVIEEDLVE